MLIMAGKFTVVNDLKANKGKCADCEYLAVRSFDNGSEAVYCTAFQEPKPITKLVTECTMHQKLYIDNYTKKDAWMILKNPDGVVEIQSPHGVRWIDGHMEKIVYDNPHNPFQGRWVREKEEPTTVVIPIPPQSNPKDVN